MSNVPKFEIICMQNVVKLLVKFPCYCQLTYLDSISGVREPLDSFRNQEGHLARPSVTDGVHKHLCALVLSLSPGIRPTKNDSVGLHASKTTGLNPANSGYSLGNLHFYIIVEGKLTCDRCSH